MGSPHGRQWQGSQPGGYWAPPPAGPPVRTRKRWLWLLPLVVVIVAGAVAVPIVLSDGDEPTSEVAAEDEASPAVEMPEEEMTPRPKDRDPEAVEAALRQLDPCKLHDLEVARQRGRTEAETIPEGQRECILTPGPDYDQMSNPGIHVRVGVKSDHLMRYGAIPATIGGAKTYESSEVSDLTSSCRVVIPVSFERAIELEYRVYEKAELCPTVRLYAEGTVAKLKNPDAVSVADPQGGGVAPQRPLLYGPNDNDTGAVGACVDFGATGGLADCEPYHDVPLPTKLDEILAAAGDNRNVQCAVFKEAVERVFGTDFSPITWAAHCYFVDPTHVFDINVNVDPNNRPSDYGRGDLYAGREETEIAGMAAVTFWTSGRGEFEIYLSPHDDLGSSGNLHIRIGAQGGRGDEITDLDQTITAEQAEQAREVMTQVVEEYFS